MKGPIMTHFMSKRFFSVVLALALAAATPATLQAHDPEYSTDFNRSGCTFTTAGNNPFLPLLPGLSLTLEGEEEDDEGELVTITAVTTILQDTETVDGVLTRILEEVESEDGELVEVSRNFVAICRETGDVWYFGEDVDDYEDGEIVGHEGAWRAGVKGAVPGILMPGSPILGARYFQEVAPGVALDQGEIISFGDEVTVPAGTFTDTLQTLDTDALDPESINEKFYARGLGNIKDEVLELIDITLPSCTTDANTLCLNDGRFAVTAAWKDFNNVEGHGTTLLPGDDSGEFWFFSANNTELIVKLLDACELPGFNSFWVFAAGTTNVEVTLTVTDTMTGEVKEYENDLGMSFEPLLDTAAFLTCDASPE